MADVEVCTSAAAPAGMLAAVRALLDEAFAGAFGDHDWDHALGGWHAVVAERGEVVAHAAVVPRRLGFGGYGDDGRWLDAGYVEAVATSPAHQGRGLGSLAMTAIGAVLRERFDVGALSTGRHGFYERLGWERWRGPSFVLDAGRRRRTDDEDDGLLVLRFGPSADLALTDPIVCRSRPGDDW